MVKGDYKKNPFEPPPPPPANSINRRTPLPPSWKNFLDARMMSITKVPLLKSCLFFIVLRGPTYVVIPSLGQTVHVLVYVGIHHDVQVSLKESLWQLSLSLKWIKQRESETDNYIISTRVHV